MVGLYRPARTPVLTEAESGGIEPLALRLRLFSKQLGLQAHAIQEESRGIEPPAFRPPRLSRPLANHLAVPSKCLSGLAVQLTATRWPADPLINASTLKAAAELPPHAPPHGFEPRLPSSEPGVLPLDERGMARPVGVEPTTSRFGGEPLAASRTQVVGEEGVEPS